MPPFKPNSAEARERAARQKQRITYTGALASHSRNMDGLDPESALGKLQKFATGETRYSRVRKKLDEEVRKTLSSRSALHNATRDLQNLPTRDEIQGIGDIGIFENNDEAMELIAEEMEDVKHTLALADRKRKHYNDMQVSLIKSDKNQIPITSTPESRIDAALSEGSELRSIASEEAETILEKIGDVQLSDLKNSIVFKTLYGHIVNEGADETQTVKDYLTVHENPGLVHNLIGEAISKDLIADRLFNLSERRESILKAAKSDKAVFDYITENSENVDLTGLTQKELKRGIGVSEFVESIHDYLTQRVIDTGGEADAPQVITDAIKKVRERASQVAKKKDNTVDFKKLVKIKDKLGMTTSNTELRSVINNLDLLEEHHTQLLGKIGTLNPVTLVEEAFSRENDKSAIITDVAKIHELKLGERIKDPALVDNLLNDLQNSGASGGVYHRMRLYLTKLTQKLMHVEQELETVEGTAQEQEQQQQELELMKTELEETIGNYMAAQESYLTQKEEEQQASVTYREQLDQYYASEVSKRENDIRAQLINQYQTEFDNFISQMEAKKKREISEARKQIQSDLETKFKLLGLSKERDLKSALAEQLQLKQEELDEKYARELSDKVSEITARIQAEMQAESDAEKARLRKEVEAQIRDAASDQDAAQKLMDYLTSREADLKAREQILKGKEAGRTDEEDELARMRRRLGHVDDLDFMLNSKNTQIASLRSELGQLQELFNLTQKQLDLAQAESKAKMPTEMVEQGDVTDIAAILIESLDPSLKEAIKSYLRVGATQSDIQRLQKLISRMGTGGKTVVEKLVEKKAAQLGEPVIEVLGEDIKEMLRHIGGSRKDVITTFMYVPAYQLAWLTYYLETGPEKCSKDFEQILKDRGANSERSYSEYLNHRGGTARYRILRDKILARFKIETIEREVKAWGESNTPIWKLVLTNHLGSNESFSQHVLEKLPKLLGEDYDDFVTQTFYVDKPFEELSQEVRILAEHNAYAFEQDPKIMLQAVDNSNVEINWEDFVSKKDTRDSTLENEQLIGLQEVGGQGMHHVDKKGILENMTIANRFIALDGVFDYDPKYNSNIMEALWSKAKSEYSQLTGKAITLMREYVDKNNCRAEIEQFQTKGIIGRGKGTGPVILEDWLKERGFGEEFIHTALMGVRHESDDEDKLGALATIHEAILQELSKEPKAWLKVGRKTQPANFTETIMSNLPDEMKTELMYQTALHLGSSDSLLDPTTLKEKFSRVVENVLTGDMGVGSVVGDITKKLSEKYIEAISGYEETEESVTELQRLHFQLKTSDAIRNSKSQTNQQVSFNFLMDLYNKAKGAKIDNLEFPILQILRYLYFPKYLKRYTSRIVSLMFALDPEASNNVLLWKTRVDEVIGKTVDKEITKGELKKLFQDETDEVEENLWEQRLEELQSEVDTLKEGGELDRQDKTFIRNFEQVKAMLVSHEEFDPELVQQVFGVLVPLKKTDLIPLQSLTNVLKLRRKEVSSILSDLSFDSSDKFYRKLTQAQSMLIEAQDDEEHLTEICTELFEKTLSEEELKKFKLFLNIRNELLDDERSQSEMKISIIDRMKAYDEEMTLTEDELDLSELRVRLRVVLQDDWKTKLQSKLTRGEVKALAPNLQLSPDPNIVQFTIKEVIGLMIPSSTVLTEEDLFPLKKFIGFVPVGDEFIQLQQEFKRADFEMSFVGKQVMLGPDLFDLSKAELISLNNYFKELIEDFGIIKREGDNTIDEYLGGEVTKAFAIEGEGKSKKSKEDLKLSELFYDNKSIKQTVIKDIKTIGVHG